MFTVYKGLLLFVLIASTLALPIKRNSDDGKMVVFEKIRTVLNCVCYYEEGQTLDNDKIDEYCDCTPEKIESDKSLVDESEVSKLKSANGKYIHGESEENLTDVQRYGSADAAFFENLEENEAKEDQILNDDNTISLSGNNGKFLTNMEDDVAAAEDDIVEDIPEYNSINEDVISADNKKYVVSKGFDLNLDDGDDDEIEEVGFIENTRYVYNGDNSNTITETEDILDENGNVIHVQVEMLGEAYEEDNDLNDDEDENVESRPTITRTDNSNRKILNEFNEPLAGADARYVINYYNENEEIDDETEEIDLEEDDEEEYVVDDDDDDEVDDQTGEVVKYRKANELHMVSTDNENTKKEEKEEQEDDESTYDHINDDDDLRTIYKKLVIKKLKSDIKNMDSEKLIVDIIKEALQGNGSNNENPLKNILDN